MSLIIILLAVFNNFAIRRPYLLSSAPHIIAVVPPKQKMWLRPWSSLMFNKAIVIAVAMDKEVLHWHCIFSLAMFLFCYHIHRSRPTMVQTWVGADFLGISGREKVLNFYPEI